MLKRRPFWTVITVCAALLGSSPTSHADFTAFNDFGGGSGSTATTFTQGQSGLLRDFATGTNSPVTLSVVAGTPAPAVDNGNTNGGMPTSSTDAHTVFNGFVVMTGYTQYNVTTPNFSSLQLNFTGLNPAKTYDIVLTGNRNEPTYTARRSMFTIADVDAFTNSHSAGTTVITTTVTDDSVHFVTGYNTVNGQVARWTGVQPGADGDMTINVTAPPGSDGRWYINALRLIEGTGVSGGDPPLTFQHGVNGYTGGVDTSLLESQPNANNGATAVIEWDGDDPSSSGQMNFGLIRFDNIFGAGANQIKPTDTITSAVLRYDVTNGGNAGTINAVLVDWTAAETFNSFGGDPGVQADEYGPDLGSAPGGTGTQSVDVTSSLIAWKASPSSNRGWIFRPTGGTDGVEFRSNEDGTPSLRPMLQVTLNQGAPSGQFLTVRHQPYLQLGNAPLATTGPGIGLTDQMMIVWQTVRTGTGDPPNDVFEVEYRLAGGLTWTSVAPITQLNTGTQTRVNHSVLITGLPWDTTYDYRVLHKRGSGTPVVVNTYTGTFTTRLPMGDATPFRFAAYGDSARLGDSATMARFESVMSRVTASNAGFVALLGDSIYDTGTHDAYDARMDASVAPIQSAYIRNHIEYYCDGNHDSGDPQSGLAGRQNYYVPIPVQGVTSPVAAAVNQPAEDNYSYDHGLVHFAIIDSTVWGGITGPGPNPISSTSQAQVLAWLDADLAATSQPWKVVCTHHPPKSWFGHTDTGEGMAAELIPVLVNRDVDLLLVGHSHNYQRSFPLTGYAAGNVTYDMDPDGVYIKGGQVIEVVAGTGGRAIDSGAPTTAQQWLARALGSNNGGDVGPLIIDVSTAELRVKYTRASTGAVLDEFVIIPAGPQLAVLPAQIQRTVFIDDPLSDDIFTVSNSSIGSLTYAITDDADWLTVTPDSGDSSGEVDQITLEYDLSGLLLAGTYNATVTVTSPEASNSPKTVSVQVTIETVRPDFDGDRDVDMDDFSHLQACMMGTGNAITDPACFNARLDNDNDIDGGDVQLLRNCMSGAGIPAERTCDD